MALQNKKQCSTIRLRIHEAIFAILILGFGMERSLYASPWMRSSEESLISTGLGYSEDFQSWDSEGHFVPHERHHQFVYSFHYERGYTYYYNIFAGAAYKYRDSQTALDRGLSSLRVGVRGRLQKFRNGRTWQITMLLPTKRVGPSPEDPGEGASGLHAGLFYRLIPDPYEKPFTKFPFGVWSGSIGILTLRSGDAVDEVQANGKWEKNFLRTPFGIALQWSALSSIFEAPLVVPYSRVQSEGSLRYTLQSGEGISISYAVDILGRNITQGNSLKISYSYRWE